MLLASGPIFGLTLEGLPAAVKLKENSPAGTEVFCFEIDFSTGASIAPGFPLILKSNPLTPDFMVSMVNSTHAKVTVTGSPNLDFESPSNHFALQLLVVDSSKDFDMQTLTIILTDVDEPPVFLDEISVLYIVERSPRDQIYQPNVSDPENKLLTFTLTPLNTAFSIDHSRGSVFTIKEFDYLTDPRRMDRDSAPLRDDPTITVTVMASFSPPGPPLSNSITLTVTVNDINDNPPICFADDQRREVPETEVKGALITTITCTDNDLNGSLDIEDPGSLYASNEYSLLIIAQDRKDTNLKGDAFLYVTVSLVNEFPPRFSPVFYSYTISELLGHKYSVSLTSCGAIIGSVNATDKDLPPTPLLYSMVSAGSSGGLRSIFHLDPKQGQISLLTHPGYEDTRTHILIIRVVDGDLIRPQSATATVIINITEANDEPPLCGPNKTNLLVPVDLRVGATVQGASNVNNHFGFSPSTGSNVSHLILREPFDYSNGLDTQWSYTLTALISDANLGSASIQTGTVIINVRVVDPHLTTVITTTTEVTNINTVFDGEGVDPVSKRVYEYNSMSGARRWKDAIIVSEPALIRPESSTLVISDRPANAESPPRSGQSESSVQARSDQSPASIQPHSGSDQSNV
ncbi:hypothetical protein AOLI_G00183810 [Acnodon oligacanthus]